MTMDRGPHSKDVHRKLDGNGIEVCGKWELRRGNVKKSVHTVTRKHLQKH